MLLLAIDTSTTAITVALHDGAGVVAEQTTLDARGHAEHLAPGIASALAEVGAAAPVTSRTWPSASGRGRSPGCGSASSRAARSRSPSVPGCTVSAASTPWPYAAAASGRVTDGELLVATDARRKEVYWARYAVVPASDPRARGVRRLTEPEVTRPADLPVEVVALPGVGRGPLLYPTELPHGIRDEGLLDVSGARLADLVVARLADGVALDEQEPLYLRRPDAVPSAQQGVKSALG